MKIKPMNRDVALRLVKETTRTTASGLVVVNNHEESEIKTYEVIAVSNKVTSVKVGDKVMLPWSRITVPVQMDVEGESIRVGFTSEDEILGVLE